MTSIVCLFATWVFIWDDPEATNTLFHVFRNDVQVLALATQIYAKLIDKKKDEAIDNLPEI